MEMEFAFLLLSAIWILLFEATRIQFASSYKTIAAVSSESLFPDYMYLGKHLFNCLPRGTVPTFFPVLVTCGQVVC